MIDTGRRHGVKGNENVCIEEDFPGFRGEVEKGG